MPPRGRPRKIVKMTTDYPDSDIVSSSNSQTQSKPHSRNVGENRQRKLETQKFSQPSTASKHLIKPSIPLGRKISIEEIKRQILSQTPDMKSQIDILDEQTLREIYESEVKPALERIQEETQVCGQSEQQQKRSQRTPEIRQMIEEIVKNVPNMKQEVELLEDDDIKELFEDVCPSSKLLFANGNTKNLINGKNTENLEEIRKYIAENLPDMLAQIQVLSDDDLMDLYREIKEKDNESESQTKAKSGNNRYPRIQPKDASKQTIMPRHGYEPYDPMQKFTKIQHEADSSSMYSFPRTPNRKEIPMPIRTYPSINPYQVHTFHNNRRVTSTPADVQRCARTVIIVHTMEPGYIPQIAKMKCRCQCCARRQFDMKDPSSLDQFIEAIVPRSFPRR